MKEFLHLLNHPEDLSTIPAIIVMGAFISFLEVMLIWNL